MATITLHALPSSHPCLTAEAALRLKGVTFERVDLVPGQHAEEVERIYGAGARTVPGLLHDGEPVHGSRAILARLDELYPSPALYPEAIAEEVREAERWGDEVLQDLSRRLVFGALHFRPEAVGTFAGAGPLDPAGTDFAITYVRQAWRYRGITAVQVAEDLTAIPGVLDHVDGLAAAGIVDGEEPTAADLQLGASLRLLLAIGDLRPLMEGRPAAHIGQRWFDDEAGAIPAGAFPAGWVA